MVTQRTPSRFTTQNALFYPFITTRTSIGVQCLDVLLRVLQIPFIVQNKYSGSAYVI